MRLRLRFITSALLVLAFSSVSAAQSGSPTATAAEVPSSGRIIVKLRAPFAQEVEAALPITDTRISTNNAPTGVRKFLSRHSAKALRAAFPEMVRAKKAQGISGRQLAIETRQKFARRASRLAGRFDPPDVSRIYVLELANTSRAELEHSLALLSTDPAIEYAEEDRPISINLTTNDPYFSSSGSWGQNYRDLWGLQAIGAPAAWDRSSGDGIIVAVVDSGVDYNHPDITGNIWANSREIPNNGLDDDRNGYIDDVVGWDFVGPNWTNPQSDNDPIDDHGHGTHVAGTIAAVGNNGVGVVGVAWHAKIMPLKALDRSGTGPISSLADAIVYAASNGADVINNSWGGKGESPTIADAVDYAYNLGVVIVAAAGNNKDDARYYLPGNLWNVITVAAVDSSGWPAWFTNWGSKIDVAAPGWEILSLRASGTTMGNVVGDSYMRSSGTSMAAPHVSGVAALLLSAHPEFSSEDVRQALRVSASDKGTAGFDREFGYGLLNAAAAVAVDSVLQSKISSPADGTYVKAPIAIEGIVNGAGLVQFTLEYGAGHLPNSWSLLHTGTGPVSGTVGMFDPSTLPDGLYSIRLTALDGAGRKFVDRIELIVDYVKIVSPAPPQQPSGAGTFKSEVPIVGTTSGGSFRSYRIEWAKGINPTLGWNSAGVTLTAGGTASIENGLLGTWDAGAQTAGYYTIRLRVENADYTGEARTLVYIEPDLLSSNWPKWLNSAPWLTAGPTPLIDGSGNATLALNIPSYSDNAAPAMLRVFSPDGSSERSVQLDFGNYGQAASGQFDGSAGEQSLIADGRVLRVVRSDNTSYTFVSPTGIQIWDSQPVLEDIDGDSHPEAIAYGTRYFDKTTEVFVWRSTGEQLKGFPLTIVNRNQSMLISSVPRVLVGDIDGDGKRELVTAEGTSETTFTIKLFGNDGSPKQWAAGTFNGAVIDMVLADLDNNGKLQVLASTWTGSSSTLRVFQPDGSERAGWPRSFTEPGSLAVGDLDRDGRPEIVFSGRDLQAFRADGTSMPNWPVRDSDSHGPATIVDIDGDGYPEVITSTGGRYQTSNPLFPEMSSTRNAVLNNGRLGHVLIKADPQLSFDPVQYFEMKLVAYRRDGTIARSWHLPGANGYQPAGPAIVAAGDFNKDSLTELAISSPVMVPLGLNSWILSEGVMTVLATVAPFDPSVSDWPMIYQNRRNTSVFRMPTSTTATLSTSANTTIFSEPVILTATITGIPPTSGTPIGAVEFRDGTTVLGSCVLEGGSCSLTISTLTLGSHSILAAYAGGEYFGPSTSAAASISVGKASSRIEVTADKNPADASEGAVFTAKVSLVLPATAVPSGFVLFKEGDTELGPPAAIDEKGESTIGPVSLPGGSHVISASFAGDETSSGSSSTMTHVVRYGTAVSLSSSPSQSVVGEPVELRATVSAVPFAQGTLSGQVDFFDADAKIGSAAINANGLASLNVSTFAKGEHILSATYQGDSTFSRSTTASTLTQVVVAPDFTLSGSETQIVAAGQKATFTITVTPKPTPYNHAVSGFTCSGLPQASSCVFTPTSVIPGSGPATVEVSIATTAASVAALTPSGGKYLAYLGVVFGFAGVVVLTGREGRKKRTALFVVLLGCLLSSACGGGSAQPQPPTKIPGTPAGTYTITIEATGTNLKHSTTVTLTVR